MDEPKKSVQIMTKQVREREVMKTAPKSLTRSLLWVSFASSILTIHHGYFIWIIYSPGVLLREYYNPVTFQAITQPRFKILEMAIIVSITPLGGIFASVTAGFLADILGRKGCLVVANITAMTAAVLMSGRYFVKGIEFTFFSSLFTGLSAGFILCIFPLYVGEIAPRNCRGIVVFIHQFCLNIGLLAAQILGIKELLGNSEGWPALMGIGAILPLIQLFLLPFMPETPSYLMIHKKNEKQARKVLKKLRETNDVEDEIVELYQEDVAEGNNKVTTPLKLIMLPSMRLQVITIIVIMAGSQLSGISVAYFSTERIFLMMIDRSYLKYLNSGAILIMTLSVLLGMYLIDSVGRRPLLLGSFAIFIITTVLLIVSLRLQKMVKELTYFSSIVLILFICAYDIGAASAFVISGSVFWSISFITGLSFYYIETQFGSYSAIIFWPFSIATLLYIYKLVPETMMLTFPEVKRAMSNKTTKKFRTRDSRRKLNAKRPS